MTDPRCGTPAGYHAHRYGRTESCAPCRAAHSRDTQRYRIRRYLAHTPLSVDGTGTHRRLQALHRIGWTGTVLGARLGVTRDAVNQLTRNRTVYRTTALRVAALYDELWDQPGPSTRTALYAKRAGWPPPLAWDDDGIDDPAAQPHLGHAWSGAFDEVAVLRAMYGDPVHLRPTERAEATRRLTAAGLSAGQIAERLNVTKRSVVRQRARTEEVA